MFAGSLVISGAIAAHTTGVVGMALSGALGAGGIGLDTPYSSGNLDTVAWIDEHDPSPFARAASATLTGTLCAVPVAGSANHAAVRCKSFGDDWYDRIHFMPQSVSLDISAGNDATTLTVWNAWFEPRTLTAIDVAPDIVFSGSLPMDFAALGLRTFQVSIGPQAAQMEGDAGFVFDDGTVLLPVEVQALVLWSFTPNWEEGVIERLTWATDILRSETLVEQRRALRIAPRREFEASFVLGGGDRRLFDLLLFKHGAGDWLLPVWPHVQMLRDDLAQGAAIIPVATTGRDFDAGSYVALIGDHAGDYAFYPVASIAAASVSLGKTTNRRWPAGTRVYPARRARLSGEPSLRRIHAGLFEFEASFVLLEACDVSPAPPAATYRGVPVLERPPDETEPLSREYGRLIATLDSGLGAQAQITNVGGRAQPMTGWRWFGDSAVAHARFRELLYWLAGRWRALWVPGFGDDLEAVSGRVAENFLTIRACGYGRFGFNQAGRTDVRIATPGSAPFYTRIVSVEQASGQREMLLLDSYLPFDVTPETQIGFMTLSRADSDSVEIGYQSDIDGVATAELIFRGVRDDEF
ncbi:MAG: hypothetical protein LBI92_06890 [Azoarcus sp.]|jgi:hypothetical protein|nr:hypothetical protein [Azoarcus sp.]